MDIKESSHEFRGCMITTLFHGTTHLRNDLQTYIYIYIVVYVFSYIVKLIKVRTDRLRMKKERSGPLHIKDNSRVYLRAVLNVT